MATGSIEERLSALEIEMTFLRQNFEGEQHPWWKEWARAFLHDPIFEEAMTCGREWRKG